MLLFLPQSEDMRVRLIGDVKLPISLSANGCLSLSEDSLGRARPEEALVGDGWMDGLDVICHAQHVQQMDR